MVDRAEVVRPAETDEVRGLVGAAERPVLHMVRMPRDQRAGGHGAEAKGTRQHLPAERTGSLRAMAWLCLHEVVRDEREGLPGVDRHPPVRGPGLRAADGMQKGPRHALRGPEAQEAERAIPPVLPPRHLALGLLPCRPGRTIDEIGDVAGVRLAGHEQGLRVREPTGLVRPPEVHECAHPALERGALPDRPVRRAEALQAVLLERGVGERRPDASVDRAERERAENPVVAPPDPEEPQRPGVELLRGVAPGRVVVEQCLGFPDRPHLLRDRGPEAARHGLLPPHPLLLRYPAAVPLEPRPRHRAETLPAKEGVAEDLPGKRESLIEPRLLLQGHPEPEHTGFELRGRLLARRPHRGPQPAQRGRDRERRPRLLVLRDDRRDRPRLRGRHEPGCDSPVEDRSPRACLRERETLEERSRRHAEALPRVVPPRRVAEPEQPVAVEEAQERPADREIDRAVPPRHIQEGRVQLSCRPIHTAYSYGTW